MDPILNRRRPVLCPCCRDFNRPIFGALVPIGGKGNLPGVQHYHVMSRILCNVKHDFRVLSICEWLCCINAPGLNPRALEGRSPAFAGEEIRHRLCPWRRGSALLRTRRSGRRVFMQQSLCEHVTWDSPQPQRGFLRVARPFKAGSIPGLNPGSKSQKT